MIDQALPVLQGAVDALYARINRGRVHSTGTAIVTGLTGRVDNLTEDETAILGDAMGSKYSDRLLDIWSRDELHAAGASEDDWALESEFAYQAIRRGLGGDALKLIVERIMRAGPYRSKWDERRGAVTWLAQDVANAIATVQGRLKKYQTGPTFEWDEEIASEAPAAEETCPQTVARLQRELAQARTLIATQQTVIRAERAEKDAAKARLGEIMAVLRNDRLSPTSRVVAIVLGETAEQLRAHGHTSGDVIRADLARKAGVSEPTITRESKRLCMDVEHPALNPDAPIAKAVTTVWRNVDGEDRPTSTITIAAKPDTPSILAAFATFAPPEERKHGGARVKGCPDHPGAGLVVRSSTHCAECDRQLGETRFTTLPNQLDSVGTEPTAPVLDSHSVDQLDSVDADDERAAAMAATPEPIRIDEHRAGRLADQVETVGRIRFTHAQEPPPPRCASAGCTRSTAPGDGWYCAPCRSRVSEPFTPSAEWQPYPPGFACPPGVEWRTNLTTGQSEVRWRAAAVAGGEE
jgi:hypothetical protein